jgi:hypothetical protein
MHINISIENKIISIPIEKALMIPKIREQIISTKNRNFYLDQILKSNMDKNMLISVLHIFLNQ